MEQIYTQRPEKLNVWCGVIGYHVIGLFSIDGNLNSKEYLRLLRRRIVPTLRELFSNYQSPELPAETIGFQQDGAPPHFGGQVGHYLKKRFLADG